MRVLALKWTALDGMNLLREVGKVALKEQLLMLPQGREVIPTHIGEKCYNCYSEFGTEASSLRQQADVGCLSHSVRDVGTDKSLE